MARLRRRTTRKLAVDTYGNPIEIGDRIVFSWGGGLHKAIVISIKLGIRASLFVNPLNYEEKPYMSKDKTPQAVMATVKDSHSVVKI